jgi:predicted O-linked N-acetylglucosamine transferase (SPINDLY family)
LTPAEAIHRANAAYARSDWTEAERLCRAILRTRADYVEALNLLGIIGAQTGRLELAVEVFGRAAIASPGQAVVHNNHANALRSLGRLGEALEGYDRALRLKPDYAEAHNSRGCVLHQLGRFADAASSFDRALALKADYAEAFYNRALARQEVDRNEEAVLDLERAVALQPWFAEAHYNLGNALRDLGRPNEAARSFERAVETKANFAQAHNNLGSVLESLGLHAGALRSYDRAIEIEPNLAAAHFNRAKIREDLGGVDEASADYERALASDPTLDWLRGASLHLQLRRCQWRGLQAEMERISSAVADGRRAVQAHTVVFMSDDPALQRRAATICAQDSAAFSRSLEPIARQARHDKIRVGYFSADYHNHATAQLAAGLFELHDRSRFEVFGFSFGPHKSDPMRRRLAAGFDRLINVRERSDREIAQLSRDMEIDVAIDLNGFTRHSRTGIFARRAAPVQINYLGYPGTMGSSFIDYMVADRTVIPAHTREHYAERIIYLPDSYQVNDHRRPIATFSSSREAMGLPADGFVFCCFNASAKITPDVFASWLRILTQTPDSVLWLLGDNATAQSNLRGEATMRGIDPERLIFAPHLPPAQHLARHSAADLFLDTFPCNAHTTASDALWGGVPLLTRTGRSFASRVAASLLKAIGLEDLITSTAGEYETVAVRLATHPEEIARLKRGLIERRNSAPLFDTPRFTRQIEEAYRRVYERYQNGLEPQDIEVQ